MRPTRSVGAQRRRGMPMGATQEGGIDQYVQWGGGSSHADFYTKARAAACARARAASQQLTPSPHASQPSVIQLYKNHIKYILSRTNTINGRSYASDPTIMAWNLANEARCQGCSSSTMQNWISDTCNFVKSSGAQQLVRRVPERAPRSRARSRRPAAAAPQYRVRGLLRPGLRQGGREPGPGRLDVGVERGAGLRAEQRHLLHRLHHVRAAAREPSERTSRMACSGATLLSRVPRRCACSRVQDARVARQLEGAFGLVSPPARCARARSPGGRRRRPTSCARGSPTTSTRRPSWASRLCSRRRVRRPSARIRHLRR